VVDKKAGLLEKGFLDVGWSIGKGLGGKLVVANVHRRTERLVLLLSFLASAFREVANSSMVLKAGETRPFLTSAAALSRRASMIRRWSEVYSSSALGNWER